MRFRQISGVVYFDLGTVRLGDEVLDTRCRGNQCEVELALKTLLHDLHVEEAQEPAAKTEAERTGRLGRIGD